MNKVEIINQSEVNEPKKKTKKAKIIGFITGGLILVIIGATITISFILKNQNQEYYIIKNNIVNKIKNVAGNCNGRISYISFDNKRLNIITEKDSSSIIDISFNYQESSFLTLDDVLKNIGTTNEFPNSEFEIKTKYTQSYEVKYIDEIKTKLNDGYSITNSIYSSYINTNSDDKYRSEIMHLSKNNNHFYCASIEKIDGTKIKYVMYNTDYTINFINALF